MMHREGTHHNINERTAPTEEGVIRSYILG
jgi:hypothetical protein